jgi:hypothetical protein
MLLPAKNRKTISEYSDGNASEKIVLNDVPVPVVSAEHLIALKLFAAQNNPGRKFRELSDIKEIVNRASVNVAIVRSSRCPTASATSANISTFYPRSPRPPVR